MQGCDEQSSAGEDPLAVQCLAAETARGFDAVARFPDRITRFAEAKKRALGMADYIQSSADRLAFGRQAANLRECRTYMVFRHYTSKNQIRVLQTRSCCYSLLCPGCACARGARLITDYSRKHSTVRDEMPALRAQMITGTVVNGDDLLDRFDHLRKSVREGLKRRHRGRGGEWDKLVGGVYSIEVKRGSRSGLWHPHFHMFALVEDGARVSQEAFSAEWRDITGDSFIVDVHDVYGDPNEAFCEVFKYALKMGDLTYADNLHAYGVLRGKNLMNSFGCLRGVPEPSDLVDELLDDESVPYLDLMFRHMPGVGYVHTGVVGSRESQRAVA